MCKPSPGKIVGIGFFIVLAIIGFGFITMLLWNWLIPTLFSGPVITYWQALGLLILSKLFFSGGGHGKSHRHSSSQSSQTSWRTRLKEKMESREQHGSSNPGMDPDPADTPR